MGHAANTAEAARSPWLPGGAADPWPVRGAIAVVLVTSDPALNDLCRGWLEDAGYQVQSFLDGPAAIEQSARLQPETIVIDACGDPEAAIRVARELAAGPETCGIPRLALVPAEGDVQSPGALESTVDDCLGRPFRRWELLVRLRLLTRLGQHRVELLEGRSLHGEQTRMWSVLLDFTRRVAATPSLEALLDTIVQSAADLTCSRRVSIMLPDERQQHLRIARSIGLDESLAASARVPIGEAISGRAFETGRPVTALDDGGDLARRRGFGFRSFVSMPLVYTTMNLVHQRVGVLNITDRYNDRPFEEWELEFIDLLSSIAGSAIDDIHSRQARESLLRLERDLELARQIQRSTFPQRLPAVHGFEIDAWSEPAEKTAGDTYDVIGLAGPASGGAARLSVDHASRAILLLADATGHGIGPALSATQVRSMLRMAALMGADLAQIARHLNVQLHADLPGGRFVTAWLGELDADTATLTSFSAGQGPILHYRAASGGFEVVPTDTLPLGVTSPLDITIAAPLAMQPGDILAVISDGLLEASDAAGRRFSARGAMDVISVNCHRNPIRIRRALRKAIAEHTGGAPASDDRTTIIIKRVERGAGSVPPARESG